jgi:hypothetical protein
MDNEYTLDTWKPSEKKEEMNQSEWRKNKNGNDYNQPPDLDDFRKIKMFLKKDKPDYEIMRVFGINAETLFAIKTNRYCPVDGISFDTLSKIFNEFHKLEKMIKKLKRSTKYISDVILMDDKNKKDYKDYCEEKGKYKKSEIDEIDEIDDDYL